MSWWEKLQKINENELSTCPKLPACPRLPGFDFQSTNFDKKEEKSVLNEIQNFYSNVQQNILLKF
jgi:hypothetical protein